MKTRTRVVLAAVILPCFGAVLFRLGTLFLLLVAAALLALDGREIEEYESLFWVVEGLAAIVAIAGMVWAGREIGRWGRRGGDRDSDSDPGSETDSAL